MALVIEWVAARVLLGAGFLCCYTIWVTVNAFDLVVLDLGFLSRLLRSTSGAMSGRR